VRRRAVLAVVYGTSARHDKLSAAAAAAAMQSSHASRDLIATPPPLTPLVGLGQKYLVDFNIEYRYCGSNY